MIQRLFLRTFVLLMLGSALRADVKPAALFSDHMVIQQNAPVPMWGWADPGEKVTVTLGIHEQTTTADADGKWMVKLDPAKPEGKRLVSVRLENGTPLRDKDFYTVTTNDYLLMGGDGFTEFAGGVDVEDTGILLRDAVAEHIARLGTVSPHLDGRIQFSR